MTQILVRNKDNRFSTVRRAWAGEIAVCIGGGPSLSHSQVAMAVDAGTRIIAVNDGYRICPSADVCYFADSKWWGWHKDKPDFKSFAGQKCSIKGAGASITDESVHMLRNMHHPHNRYGLSLDPGMLATGWNSGYQALNMAILAGANRIILLGFDAHVPEAGEPTHWFGDHPKREPDHAFRHYVRAFAAAAQQIRAAGVRVINCSPRSAIEVFERMPIETAVRVLRRG